MTEQAKLRRIEIARTASQDFTLDYLQNMCSTDDSVVYIKSCYSDVCYLPKYSTADQLQDLYNEILKENQSDQNKTHVYYYICRDVQAQ